MRIEKKVVVRYKKTWNLELKQTVIALMQKISGNISNNKLNKFKRSLTT